MVWTYIKKILLLNIDDLICNLAKWIWRFLQKNFRWLIPIIIMVILPFIWRQVLPAIANFIYESSYAYLIYGLSLLIISALFITLWFKNFREWVKRQAPIFTIFSIAITILIFLLNSYSGFSKALNLITIETKANLDQANRVLQNPAYVFFKEYSVATYRQNQDQFINNFSSKCSRYLGELIDNAEIGNNIIDILRNQDKYRDYGLGLSKKKLNESILYSANSVKTLSETILKYCILSNEL